MTTFRNLAAAAVLALITVACTESASQQQVEEAVRNVMSEGQVVPATIRSRSFELVDETGAVRGVLGPNGRDSGLILFDEFGVPRVAVTTGEGDLPSITLFDELGTRRLGFEFALGISPSLFLRDSTGTLKAGFQVQGDGGPILFLRSSRGENGFAVAMLGDDVPVLSLAEPDGNHRVFLGLEEARFTPGLVFLDETGAPVATYP